MPQVEITEVRVSCLLFRMLENGDITFIDTCQTNPVIHFIYQEEDLYQNILPIFKPISEQSPA